MTEDEAKANIPILGPKCREKVFIANHQLGHGDAIIAIHRL